MTADRKLLPLRIRLPYSSPEEFAARYGARIARSGVFIATRAVKPEGTLLAFEFVLADGTCVLRGEGEVARSVVDGSGGGKPDMAQAGGADPSQIPAALDKLYELVRTASSA